MKAKLITGQNKPTHTSKFHIVLKRLQSSPTLARQLPISLPHPISVASPEQNVLQARLAATELELNRAAGLTYVNMLPPR